MFSQTTEYALRVMVYLASLDGRTPTIAQIAAATRTPAGYLAKVLRSLARAGLIRSQRGLHGGSTLARSADQITVHDVVQSVDPIQRIKTCPLGLTSHGVNLCPLHRRLDEAIALVEQALRNSTLAELVAEPTASKPLGDIPTEPATGLVPLRFLRRGEMKAVAKSRKARARAS
jgi:Rrf2 family transcriptional regulator, nitric oxide-sensitive transcriptional repressor